MQKETLRRVVQETDYRAFMLSWIKERGKLKRFGYADIARLGGFSARSFPRDVARGTKRITLNSLPGFVRGLGLNRDLADYFRLLVEREHEDCRSKNVDSLAIQNALERQRKRILARSGAAILVKEDAFQISCLPAAYAALGSVKRGGTIDEIAKRTSLARHDVQAALAQMVKIKIAEKRGERFYPVESHLSFEGLSKSEVFKKHFVWSCERSAQMAKAELKSDEKLFLSSAFSVNRHKLPQLKEELRSVLVKYIDATEQTDGDQVVNLVASLF